MFDTSATEAKRPFWKLFISLLIVTFPSVVGSQQPEVSEVASKPLRVGGIVSLTGPAAGWGEMARFGWELAIEEANAAGGVTGRKVELMLEDSRTNPTGSVSAYKKLVSVDRVDATLGDVWDFLTSPLIALSRSSKVLLVSTIIDQSTHERSPYFFTTGPRIASAHDAVDRFFELNPELKTAAILSWDNDWGHAYERVWSEAAQKAGVTIVSVQRSLDMGTDWRAEVAKISVKRPDAVIFGYQADRILKRLRELGLHPKILTTSNVVEELKLKSVSEELSEGIYYTDWTPSDAFVTRFESRFKKAPMLNAVEGYEAARSLLKAFALDPNRPEVGMLKVIYPGESGRVDFSTGPNGNYSEAHLHVVKRGQGIRLH